MVSPESWASGENKDASGEIVDVLSGGKSLITDKSVGKSTGVASAVATEWSVLVVRQTRASHRQIDAIINRLERGEDRPLDPGGLGGGGFGGGFYSVPQE